MASNRKPVEAARLRAQERLTKAEQRDKDALRHKDEVFAAMVSKTARLRSLRLAKESSDKEAAERKPAGKKTGSRSKAAAKKQV